MTVRLIRRERESATSRALDLHSGAASTLDPISALVRAVEAGDWNAAKTLNAEMAKEFSATAPIGYWFLQRIGEQWGELALGSAKHEWKEQQASSRQRLWRLARRLELAKPKIEAKQEQVAELAERLEAAQPLPEVEAMPEVEAKVAAEPLSRSVSLAKRQFALPGVAGEIQDHYLRTAMQPSEIMSVAVGLMVPTVLVSANVIGPSGPKGCALQQTVVVLAPTSSGKQWAIDTIKECVENAGAKKLLGPNRFRSGSGLVRWVKENRVSLCVQDEFGRLLARLGNPKSNQCEVEINERMREFWAMGPGSIYNSPAGAGKDDNSESITDARLSILGFGVQDEFFEACRGDDIANGFLNRIAVLEEQTLIRPRKDYETRDFPWSLKERLTKLHSIKSRRLEWSAGAREIYDAEVERVFAETDQRKLKLWSRTPLKIVRAASTFAACRFATSVERPDMELAQIIMHLSDNAFNKGIAEAEKKRQLDHAGLKLEIVRRIRDDFGGAASLSEIKRSFRHNTKTKHAIDDAIQDMTCSQLLTRGWVDTGGRRKKVYRLMEDQD